ncbi:MAG TPA: cation-transporting P-type ATPase [Thermoanaerobaculia bacterium]|nr:cation-transporting P-type ATPase [Thermoanaerobaculia bacterium]
MRQRLAGSARRLPPAGPGRRGEAVARPGRSELAVVRTVLTAAPWARSAADVAAALGVHPGEGLSAAEARRRLAAHGPNRLAGGAPAKAGHILLRQFRSLVTALLAAAAAAAFVFGEWVEGIAVAAVIALNAGIGFATELRAVRSTEALRRLGTPVARVRRGGRLREVPAAELVPGDVVLVEAGDLVAADLRLLGASRLQTDESQLTGESLPVAKRVEAVGATTPLAERACQLFRGSAVVRGSGEGVVVATGIATELGRIAELAAVCGHDTTPLERRLERLGRALAWAALAAGAITATAGALAGRDLFLMVETGIALAVAAIPEGLPIVATIALARGAWRMAGRHGLVKRLAAVETLGEVTVILTDKTGTLTANRMTVRRIAVEDGEHEPGTGHPAVRAALEVAALCSNAALAADGGAVGDPLEVALLEAAAREGIDRARLVAAQPEVREEPFDPVHRMMATVHRRAEGGFRVAVKGAPEAVLAACSRVLGAGGEELALGGDAHAAWHRRQQRLAGDGYRILGLAEKSAGVADAEPFSELTWIGLALLEDPPRVGIREAMAACRAAEIHVAMVTGDQAATARTIAREVGLVAAGEEPVVVTGGELAARPWSAEQRRRLLRACVFARVDPGQKLDLVALHQVHGAVVAMTGDGVNDAPALEQADVGIAMGRRGHQVAREAADLVLEDDSFATIVAAIRQGRVIFDNIRRSALYLLSCNAGEVVVVSASALLDTPLPVLPLQLLFLNLVTDVFPALALGLGEGDPRVMGRAPRDLGKPLLAAPQWRAIAAYALAMAAAVFGALAWSVRGLGLGEERAVTVAFLTLAFAQLWHVFNMRAPGSALFANEVTRNPYVWGSLVLCAGLLLATVALPPLAAVLHLAAPGAAGWGVAAVMSLLPLALGQAFKEFR